MAVPARTTNSAATNLSTTRLTSQQNIMQLVSYVPIRARQLHCTERQIYYYYFLLLLVMANDVLRYVV